MEKEIKSLITFKCRYCDKIITGKPAEVKKR